MDKDVGEVLLKHSHTKKISPTSPFERQLFLLTLYHSSKMSWEAEGLVSFQMFEQAWHIKGRKREHFASCSVIVMKYILKYECMINPQGYVDERIENKGMDLI